MNVYITGDMSSYSIEASHPAHSITVNNCDADFTNCPTPGPDSDYSLNISNKPFDINNTAPMKPQAEIKRGTSFDRYST